MDRSFSDIGTSGVVVVCKRFVEVGCSKTEGGLRGRIYGFKGEQIAANEINRAKRDSAKQRQ